MTIPGNRSKPQRILVGIAEVARLVSVERGTVDQWRRRDVMPQPDFDLEGGPVWWSDTILQWARSTGRA